MAEAVGQNSASGREGSTTGAEVEAVIGVQSTDGKREESVSTEDQSEGKRKDIRVSSSRKSAWGYLYRVKYFILYFRMKTKKK